MLAGSCQPIHVIRRQSWITVHTSRLEKVGGDRCVVHFHGLDFDGIDFHVSAGRAWHWPQGSAKPIPTATSVYTRVPAEYRVEHSLDASAVVCRSNLCHAKVGLRGAPRQAGRPVGWRKQPSAAAEVVVGTITKAEHVRPRPAIVTEIFQVKASRCAALHFPASPDPPSVCLRRH